MTSGHFTGACVTSASKAAEDLSTNRVVPVPESATARDRIRAERAAAQHLITRAEEHFRIFTVRECNESRIPVEVGVDPLPDVADELVNTEWRGALRECADRGRAQMPLAKVGVVRRWLLVAPRIPTRPIRHRIVAGSLLPLGLRREALAGPRRIRPCLVKAHV